VQEDVKTLYSLLKIIIIIIIIIIIDRFSKKKYSLDFMKIRPLGADMFLAYGRRDKGDGANSL